MKKRQRKMVDKGMAKARTHDSMQEVAKLTHVVNGQPRIIADPPLIVPIADLLPKDTDQAAFEARLKDLLAGYRRTLETDRRFLLEQFEYAAWPARSSASAAWAPAAGSCLMLGRDESDPLFLQVKEAEASVLSRFVGASTYTNMGQRVVAGQRLMQASSDIFLGWQRAEAGLDGKQRDFYVRQLRDWKYSIAIEDLMPHGMRIYGETMRVDAGPGARPLRRPDRHRRLPRRLRRLRPGHHPVRRRLRRSERTRPPGPGRRRRLRTDHRRTRHVRSGGLAQRSRAAAVHGPRPGRGRSTGDDGRTASEPGHRRSPQPGGALDLPGPAGGRGGRVVRAVPGQDGVPPGHLPPGSAVAGLSVKLRGGGALEVKAYRGSPGILEVPGRARGHLQGLAEVLLSLQPAQPGQRRPGRLATGT